MQNVASQRFVSRHETTVASFDIGGSRPRFEGRPMKGSRPPCAKQEPGRNNRDEPQWPCLTPLGNGQGRLNLFSFDSNPELNPQNLHRGEAIRPLEPIKRLGHLSGSGLRSCGMPLEGSTDPISK